MPWRKHKVDTTCNQKREWILRTRIRCALLCLPSVLLACSVAAGPVTAFAQSWQTRGIAYGDRKPSVDALETIRLLSANRAADLEGEVRRAYVLFARSVVRIRNRENTGGGSGVIIDQDGLVLTCSHFAFAPGTPLTIDLSDGRRVTGRALGRFDVTAHFQHGRFQSGPDLGLVQISEKGPWPAAKEDPHWMAKGGEICLAIGYPSTLPRKSAPLLRLGRLLPPLPEWPFLRPTTSTLGGDSGGPLFDLQGRVLGVASGEGRYQPLAPFRLHRARLVSGEIVTAPETSFRARHARIPNPGAFSPALDLEDSVLRTAISVVHILDGSHQVALGLIVSADGYIVTKRSLVAAAERLRCRLRYKSGPTKVVNAARVVAASTQHDLALLKIDATRMPTARFATRADSRAIGTLIASLGIEPLTFAVIGSRVSAEPLADGDRPQFGLSVKAGPRGEAVVVGLSESNAELDPYRDLLKSDDIVLRLNGIPTPTAAEFFRVQDRILVATKGDGSLDYSRPAPNSFAGDPVVLTIRRGERVLSVNFVKVNSGSTNALDWYEQPLSIRCSGFPAVFAHDSRVAPNQCGGPVVNLAGEVVGLNIARADNTRTLAIPADVLNKTVVELLAQAKTEKAN
jgi:serine protease Do